VTAIDVWQDKAQEAHNLGASSFLTFNQATASTGSSFDLLVNCASANISTPGLLGLLRNNGSLVQLGIPGGSGCGWRHDGWGRERARGWDGLRPGSSPSQPPLMGWAGCVLPRSGVPYTQDGGVDRVPPLHPEWEALHFFGVELQEQQERN
jgi:hypothetical protein